MTGDKVRPGHPKAPIYTATLWRFRSLQENVVYGGHYEPFDRYRMIGLIDGQLLDLSQYRAGHGPLRNALATVDNQCMAGHKRRPVRRQKKD